MSPMASKRSRKSMKSSKPKRVIKARKAPRKVAKVAKKAAKRATPRRVAKPAKKIVKAKAKPKAAPKVAAKKSASTKVAAKKAPKLLEFREVTNMPEPMTPPAPAPSSAGTAASMDDDMSDMPEAAAEPIHSLRVALFGASGEVGARIREELLNRGHSVTALVRHPEKLTAKNSRLKVVRGDVTDPAQATVAARNHDVVASAISPPDNEPAVLVHAAKSLLAGAREAGGRRLVVVGGAGSLEVAPGKQLLDTKEFPSDWRPVANAHREALGVFRKQGTDMPWTVVSPSAMFGPGKRTGKFRLGTDQLIADKKGNSSISMEDYAVAFVDELERGDHVGKRMTVGY